MVNSAIALDAVGAPFTCKGVLGSEFPGTRTLLVCGRSLIWTQQKLYDVWAILLPKAHIDASVKNVYLSGTIRYDVFNDFVLTCKCSNVTRHAKSAVQR